MTHPTEPEWTTGQGVGFLVAMPGWITVVFTACGAFQAAFASADNAPPFSAGTFLAAGGVALIAAILGTVVYVNCGRRRPSEQPEYQNADRCSS